MKRSNSDSLIQENTRAKILRTDSSGDQTVGPCTFNNQDQREWLLKHVSDCTISVGQGEDKKDFLASKITLSIKSPVLYMILYTSPEKQFSLPYVTVNAFELLMRYFYNLDDEEDVPHRLDSVKAALDLLHAVRKLKLLDLEDPIMDQLVAKFINPGSVFQVLEFAATCEDSRLEKVCFGVFEVETKDCLMNEMFLSVPLPKLLLLFQQERYCSEVEAFRALERYVAHNKLKRGSEDTKLALLDDVLRAIHFLIIPSETLIEELADSKLLSDREKMLLVAHSTFPDTKHPLPGIVTPEEKKFSQFVEDIFKKMRDLFGRLGNRLWKCSCGQNHDFRKVFWQHDFKSPQQLKRLETILQMASLPFDLEVVSKTEISAVKRAVGCFMSECKVNPNLFEFSSCEKYLIRK